MFRREELNGRARVPFPQPTFPYIRNLSIPVSFLQNVALPGL